MIKKIVKTIHISICVLKLDVSILSFVTTLSCLDEIVHLFSLDPHVHFGEGITQLFARSLYAVLLVPGPQHLKRPLVCITRMVTQYVIYDGLRQQTIVHHYLPDHLKTQNIRYSRQIRLQVWIYREIEIKCYEAQTGTGKF